MPVIREYRQQTSAPGPISQKEHTAGMYGAAEGEALTRAGQAVSNVGETIAKRLDQQNTSDVTAKLTKANADLSIKLQKTIRETTPGDTKPFELYQQHVDDVLGKIGEEANTASAREFYAEASVRIKGQLQQTSAAGQAELAGVKAVTDYTDTLNSLTATAMADPSSVNLQRDLNRAAIANLVKTGGLPAHKAMELEKAGDSAIAKGTMRGWIEKNPTYAREKLKSGEFDNELGAEGKNQMLGEIDQAERALEIAKEKRLRDAERVTKQKQQQTQNDFLVALTENNLDTKTILNSNLEAFGSGSKEQFLQMLKAANEKELKTDPAVMVSLFERINLPDGDPKKIVDENDLNDYVIRRQLSFSDLDRLRGELQGKGTAQGQIENDMRKQIMDLARSKLTKANPMLGIKDPVGDEQMAKFMAYFFDEYKAQRAAGVPARKLLDPNADEYLGKGIAQFQRDRKQIIRDLVPRRTNAPGSGLAVAPNTEGASASTLPTDTPGNPPSPTYKAPAPKAPPPRLPGEKPDVYLKRIKGGG